MDKSPLTGKKTLTVTLPIYYKKMFKTKPYKLFLVGLNWYRNCHYVFSNKVKQVYHELTKEVVGDHKFGIIKLHYKVYVRRTVIDGPNVRSIIEKFFLDGLVKCGAIKNDTVEYVIGDSSEYTTDRSNPRIEITIIEQ